MSDHKGPQPLPQIADIKLYVPGHAPKPVDGRKVFKLASNENPLGASEAAKEAFRSAADHLEIYPAGDAPALREAIAERYGLDAKRIICGSGSDEIFQFIARAYLTEGDEIVQSAHGFLVYQLVAQHSGARTISAPEKDYCTDVDAVLACVSEKTKIVFIANPNNPTGTYLPFEEVKRLHAGLPENVLLVLDGAYAEYMRQNDYSAGLELASESNNVLMTRTFSKIYGLAALRVGWAYGAQSIIDALHRVRGPFNVNTAAQMAAVAAIKDQAFVDKSYVDNSLQRERLTAGLRELGLQPIESVTNFVLVGFDEDGAKTADNARAFLEAQAVSVRDMKAYQLPHHLRISIGDAEGVDAVLNGLSEFMKA